MLRKLAVILFLMVGLMSWIIVVENKNEENELAVCEYIDEVEIVEMS